jgi:cytochrome c oxidase assembly protein subunit 15
VAVQLQGLLGGLRVVLLKDEIGIFHATLAQLFFVLLCTIALLTTRWWRGLSFSSWCSSRRKEALTDSGLAQKREMEPPYVGCYNRFEIGALAPWLATALTSLILAQLIVGATMRHQHAGLAIPDFPLAYGKIWPAMAPSSVELYNQKRLEATAVNSITAFQIALQMVHRLVALLILAGVAFSTWLTRRNFGAKNPLSKMTLGWFVLILAQAILGAATIWSDKAADVATAHVLLGALSLTFGALTSLTAWKAFALKKAPAKPVEAGRGVLTPPVTGAADALA